jgi:hypothetical protein
MSDDQSQYVPPPDASATSFADIEREVMQHFGGFWPNFLRAVRNPAEILLFVMNEHCGGDEAAFAAWAKEKELPEGWLGRFHMAMAQVQFQGQIKSGDSN